MWQSATLPVLSRLLSRKLRQGTFDKVRLPLFHTIAQNCGLTAISPHRCAINLLRRLQPQRQHG